MSFIQILLQMPVKLVKPFFSLVVAVMRILLGVFGFLIPQSDYIDKSKMNNYAKEAWVKSGK